MAKSNKKSKTNIIETRARMLRQRGIEIERRRDRITKLRNKCENDMNVAVQLYRESTWSLHLLVGACLHSINLLVVVFTSR
mmetsp:Transcript_28123/g.34739  ORF Transcript_28123/g.34739 Transcript_28123/m.34739 type:complete len:81 (-) Transcript_28123:11-253(-)